MIDELVASARIERGKSMAFHDNFIEVVPGFLVDPITKLRVQFGGESGLEPGEALLNVAYDPDIEPGRILVPPSEEDRKFWLLSPLTAHLADVPTVFQSPRYRVLESVRLSWAIGDGRAVYRIENDVDSFRLKAQIIENMRLSMISENGRDTLRYAISSATRLTALKAENFRSDKYSDIRISEVWIRSDVAVEFFKLPLDSFASPEPGWIVLSTREIGR